MKQNQNKQSRISQKGLFQYLNISPNHFYFPDQSPDHANSRNRPYFWAFLLNGNLPIIHLISPLPGSLVEFGGAGTIQNTNITEGVSSDYERHHVKTPEGTQSPSHANVKKINTPRGAETSSYTGVRIGDETAQDLTSPGWVRRGTVLP